MGLFDIFSSKNSDKAAQDKIAGLNAAMTRRPRWGSTPAPATANDYYGKALVPFTQLFGSGHEGRRRLLGRARGQRSGGQRASDRGVPEQPGYQTQLQYGTCKRSTAAPRRAGACRAATRSWPSRNSATTSPGRAGKTTRQASRRSSISPATGAQGIGSVNTTAAGTNYDAGKTTAQLGWNLGTGVGDANASADLAKNQAAANCGARL
jgi:hypothetical protein